MSKKSQKREAEKEAAREAVRRAIEQQFSTGTANRPGLRPGQLEPWKPEVSQGVVNLPGYYRSGGLKNVLYRNRNRLHR